MSATAVRPKPVISRSEWRVLLVLGAVQFTNVLDFVIMMPLAPLAKDDLHITSGEFGRIVGAYGYAAFVGSLLAAKFLDRFGRKQALLGLYLGFGVSTLLCGLAPTYGSLVAARALAGLFGGVAGAAVMAIVGDLFADYRRGTAMGIVMASFSVASVVGVPVGLVLAEAFGTGAPFKALAGVSAIVWLAAWFVLPPLRGHIRAGRPHASLASLVSVPTHLTAFAFTTAVVFSGFLIIPFLADSMVANAGQRKVDIKWVYLCAGLFTLVTTIVVGRWSDRFGKLPMFRGLAIAALTTGLIITNLPPVPLWVALAAGTAFMVTMSGRMVPGMAMITASAAPAVRGGFLSLNGAVQFAGMGLASTVAGELIGQAEDGRLPGYPLIGLLATGAALMSLVLAGRLRPAAGARAAAETDTVLEEAVV